MAEGRRPADRRGLAQAGFSLIELMVGLAVGLIVILVVTQTLAIFEGQKRTTASGADAQQSGLLGLFSIEQEVRMAGAGFNSIPTFSCVNFYSYYKQDAATPAAPGGTGFAPVPVLIQNGGTATASDQIIVRTGANFAGSVPSRLIEPLLSTTTPFNLLVERSYDFTNQDLIVLVDPTFTNCTLMRVTTVNAPQRQLSVASGQYPEYNPNPLPSGWPTQYPAQSWVYRVGTTGTGGVSTRTYSVDANQSLQVVDPNAAQPQILASDIVNLQVQYGISTSFNSKDIASWVNGTGSFAAATLTGSGGVTDRQRIKAIRVAIVARSKNREAGLVTSQCAAVNNNRPDCACVNAATTNFGPCAWSDDATNPGPIIDLRGDPDWQHYRYKVYQTIIPLRNSIWPY